MGHRVRFVLDAELHVPPAVDQGEASEVPEGAMRRAMASERPFVLDIHTDPQEMAPSGKRHKNLMQQGHDSGH